MRRLVLCSIVLLCLTLLATAARAQARCPSKPAPPPPAAAASVQKAVSLPEMEKTLKAINLDRTSGREGERKAAAFLEQKLREYGVKYARHDVRALLSWPGRAELTLFAGSEVSLKASAPAFGVPTPPGGLTAEIVVVPPPADGSEWAVPSQELRSKILVISGMLTPQSVLRAQDAGAAGLIHVNETDVLHEMSATSIWGTPTTGTAGRMPKIPVVSVGKGSGDQLRSAFGRGPVAVKMVTEVEKAWATLPLIVAEVPGASSDFVLVASHLDAWYEGMTDSGAPSAAVLEMARVLQAQRARLRRGVRFAWWPGHAQGSFAGSTWYADRFWMDLDRHCVAYTNLEGIGRRGSRLDGIVAGGWPGLVEYSRQYVRALGGKVSAAGTDPRALRPPRDGDSAFHGIGIPEFSVGLQGPSRPQADVEPTGHLKYWHTKDDKLDKVDLRVLDLDTRYRVAQVYDLATAVVLPHRIAPIAAAYARAIDELASTAGARFDLASTRTAAAALTAAAGKLDAVPHPSRPEAAAALNALLVRVTHRLNSALYTRAGRFDQDPVSSLAILPLVARVRELATLDPGSDTFGYLETELVRGRNVVEAALRDSTEEIQAYLAR
jgi:Zn-dependent M28 family amino/carboxypeptidase